MEKNIAGLDLPIDEPDAADWVVEFDSHRSPQILADDLLHHFL
jgi:hypothetical protein